MLADIIDRLFRRSGRVTKEPGAVPPFDPSDPAFVQNPYPVFSALRDRVPVCRTDRGLWVISRYHDVANLLTDSRVGNAPAPYAVVNERNRARYVCADVANNILPFQDPPEHNLPRRLVGKAFLEHLEGQDAAIERIARDTLAPCLKRGDMDLLGDFATPFSIAVLAHILGVPKQDESRLKAWSEWFFYLFLPLPSQDVRNRLDQNLAEFRAWFGQLVEARRARPEADLISALIGANRDGEALGEQQLIDTCMLLFADGVENVDKLIAVAMALLIAHPAEREKLAADRSLYPRAVDECLRYESPAQFIGKVAKDDIVLHGERITKDSGLLLLLGSANRDPRRFSEPDDFRIDRESKAYLSFGKGRHACLGGSLVRLELEIALRVLLDSLGEIALTDEPLVWQERLGHRWLTRLPVTFVAKHA